MPLLRTAFAMNPFPLLLLPFMASVRIGAALKAQALNFQSGSAVEPSPGRCLKFMHIPKTGGTAVADSGKKQGYNWADRDPWMLYYTYFVKKVPPLPCGPWHVPPDAMSPELVQYFSDCEVFCVVRHPVQRMISEWKETYNCGDPGFDSWVVATLDSARADRYAADCHLLPQVNFTRYSPANRGKHCQHTLKYEELKDQFESLMIDFNLPVRLNSTANTRVKEKCNFTVSREAQAQIAEFYAEDYAAFGYDPSYDNSVLNRVNH
mmetsp:Transcript_61659/g.191001  ORF Transcript_61659/g.191001 Transcript_61659/m.191001 type:complete len:264 (+) Transcript_61659:61-852(+)